MFGARTLKRCSFSLSLLAVISSLAMPAFCAEDLPIWRKNLALFSGPVTYVGQWAPDEAEFKRSYDLSPNAFGSFYTLDPMTREFAKDAAGKIVSPVRPFHIPVGKDQAGNQLVGFRLLPIATRKGNTPRTYKTADGKSVTGGQYLDAALGRTYYNDDYFKLLDKTPKEHEDDPKVADKSLPIIGLLGYYHPQHNTGALNELSQEGRYETQGGFGHAAVYFGASRGKNSPGDLYVQEGGIGVRMGEDVVDRDGNVEQESAPGEPAILYSVRMLKPGIAKKEINAPGDFEDQKKFLINARIILDVLHEGVEFPPDYTKDVMKVVSLRTVLAFWRGWLDKKYVFEDALTPAQLTRYRALTPRQAVPEELTFNFILRTNAFWQNYCAEFGTLFYNTAANIKNNEGFYTKLYGAKDGPRVWGLFKEKFIARTGKGRVPTIADDDFVTLWESDDLIAKGVDAADAAKPIIDRKHAADWGRALIWKPMKTVNVLAAFLGTYTNWTRYGAPTATIMGLGTASVAMDRMKIKFPTFTKVANPILASVLAHEIGWNRHRNPESRAKIIDASEWKAIVEAYLAGIKESVKGLPVDENAKVTRAEELANLEDLQDLLLPARERAGQKNLREQANRLVTLLADPNRPNTNEEGTVYSEFLTHVQPAVEAAEKVQLGGVGTEFDMAVADYTPPKVMQKIVHNVHQAHERIVIKAEGLVVDAKEVRSMDADGETPKNDLGEPFIQLDPLKKLPAFGTH